MARILEYDLNLLTNYLIKYPYDEIKLTIDEIERIACGSYFTGKKDCDRDIKTGSIYSTDP